MISLKEPGMWSVLIASLALVLSQLPPVRQMLKRQHLHIVAPEIMTLYHFLGNLNILGFVALHNIGGRALTVAKVDCVITCDGPQRHLPGQTYQVRSQSSTAGQPPAELLMDWNVLKPGEHWSETVHFYKAWTEQDEEDAMGIIGKIKNDINQKLASRQPGVMMGPAEANEELVREAKAFFEERFKLAKGNYRLLIAALSEKGQVLAVRGFDFTLFENQIRALRSATDDYKIGAGVYFANTDPAKQVTIRLRPVSDEEARQNYSRVSV